MPNSSLLILNPDRKNISITAIQSDVIFDARYCAPRGGYMYANSIASVTKLRKLCLWQNDFVLLMQVLLQLNFCVWDNETASAAFVTASAAASVSAVSAASAAASAGGGGREDGGVVVATSSDMSPLLLCAIICWCDE